MGTKLEYIWKTDENVKYARILSQNISHEQILLTPLRPFGFWDFRKKKHMESLVFTQEYLRSCWAYGPGRSVKKRSMSSSLHSKNNFLPRGWFFYEWRHKWRTFRPLWPNLPGPVRQPLGGSVSLKFLLETRLQSESFDNLRDLLEFRIQKLWC